MALYGDNSKRLCGEYETSKADTFSWGYGDRSSSVRVPTIQASNGNKGYIEDRRPASDMDPYVVGATLINTIILNNPALIEDLQQVYLGWKEWKKDADIP